MFWWTVFITGKTRQQTVPDIPETCYLCTTKAFKRGVRMTLQQQDITTPLGVDEIVEWCNSFLLIPKHPMEK